MADAKELLQMAAPPSADSLSRMRKLLQQFACALNNAAIRMDAKRLAQEVAPAPPATVLGAARSQVVDLMRALHNQLDELNDQGLSELPDVRVQFFFCFRC